MLNTGKNLIPDTPKKVCNYICTWNSQALTAKKLGLTGKDCSEQRDVIDSKHIFGSESYYHLTDRKFRKDLIFLMDDGWDVPYGTPNDAEHKGIFGSLIPDAKKFAEFGADPLTRLSGLSKKVKEMGYMGLGLWVSPQIPNETVFDPEAARIYWEDRADFCHKAGVLYWKVDWGFHTDTEYRKLISRAVKKCAPEIIVEHAVTQAPLSLMESDDLATRRGATAKELMQFCDVFRTYDVCHPFDDVCTLKRAAEALTASVERDGDSLSLVNAESQGIVAAALGLCVGVMEYDNNMAACLNWHRIAPPFSIRNSYCICSEDELCDTLYCETDIADWFSVAGKTVTETAPAVIARGCSLPEINCKGPHAPFVTLSKNPENNAFAVACFKRNVDGKAKTFCPADVTVKEADPEAYMGVFGEFGSLTFEFTGTIKGRKVLIQDLVGDTSFDVTNKISVSDSALTLSGNDIALFGKSGRDASDTCEPAFLIKLF